MNVTDDETSEVAHAALRDVVISGIGQSDVGRRLFRPGLDLTLDAAFAAIGDAGLSIGDIDGLATYPGGQSESGFAGPSLTEVHDALRLELSWYASGSEVAAQMGPILHGAMAIATGMARHVLVYRTVTEGSARARAKAMSNAEAMSGADTNGESVHRDRPSPRVEGWQQWLAPYGVSSAPQWYAFHLRSYMHRFGVTRAQLGELAVHSRRMSARNDRAVYREPLTIDDYLESRMISDPVCLYDCDVPCDGATAFVLSHRLTSASTARRRIRFEAFGAGAGPRMFRDQVVDPWFAQRASEQLWSRTDLRPADVDVAMLYDGISFLALQWLESLRFCGRGEAGAFIEGGRRIALDGTLPLNTNGGQLAGGRLHGFGLLHEACLQLRGEASLRQVPGAEVALVAVGGMPNMGCALLTVDR